MLNAIYIFSNAFNSSGDKQKHLLYVAPICHVKLHVCVWCSLATDVGGFKKFWKRQVLSINWFDALFVITHGLWYAIIFGAVFICYRMGHLAESVALGVTKFLPLLSLMVFNRFYSETKCLYITDISIFNLRSKSVRNKITQKITKI